MALDLILSLILALMFGVGAWRGAVASGSGLFSLICGYGGGILAATRGSAWVAENLLVSTLVAPAIAGTIGFVTVWILASSITDVMVAWDRERVAGSRRNFYDRALGGLLGLARGGLIVVLLAILASWLDAARDLGAISALAAIPDAENSALARVTGNLVEAAVTTALADKGPTAEVVARLTARPGQTLASAQRILEDKRLNAMLEDRLFWTLLSNDSVDYAMNRNAIRSIVQDPEMRGRFADLGLVGEEAREDADVFRASMAVVLAEVGPKITQLQQDPEVIALSLDPEIMALVEQGNTFALMNHPRIRKIVSRVSAAH